MHILSPHSRLQVLTNQFSVFKNTGNILQACQSARDIASLNIATNLTYSVQCLNSAKTCQTQCDDSSALQKERFELKSLKDECANFQQNSKMGMNQAQYDAKVYLDSKACSETVAADCSGTNAQYNTQCIQYCAQNNNSSSLHCKVANTSCMSMDFYQKNSTFCECLRTPVGAGCNQLRYTDLDVSSLKPREQEILLKQKVSMLDTSLVTTEEENAILAKTTYAQAPNQPAKDQAFSNQDRNNQTDNNPQKDTKNVNPPLNQGSNHNYSNTSKTFSERHDPSHSYPSQNFELAHNNIRPTGESEYLQKGKVNNQEKLQRNIINHEFKTHKKSINASDKNVIYYQESERMIASENMPISNLTKIALALLLIVLMIAAYKFNS